MAEGLAAPEHAEESGEMGNGSIAETGDVLTKLLAEKSGAARTWIDVARGSFRFEFRRPGRGVSIAYGAPWQRIEPVVTDPRLEAEALFNKTGLGFVRISDEDAAWQSKQDE